jgi:hypothetical protein
MAFCCKTPLKTDATSCKQFTRYCCKGVGAKGPKGQEEERRRPRRLEEDSEKTVKGLKGD